LFSHEKKNTKGCFIRIIKMDSSKKGMTPILTGDHINAIASRSQAVAPNETHKSATAAQ
jgi:hypothetical protein